MSGQQYFTSQKNYLKRHPLSGSASVSAPSTSISGLYYRTTYTITHNLGYVPRIRVYYENSASDGKIYPAGGRRNGGTYVGLPFNSIYCLWEATSTTLTIYLESATTKTGVRNVYWVIYQDVA